MLLKLLSMAVLLGFIQVPHQYTIPPSNPSPVYELYLPLAINQPLVDFTKLGVSDQMGYPGEKCIHGYVTDNSPTAVYSVTMAIEVVVYPYCPEEPCPPVSETHYAKPMLDATLPDQKNLFSYCLVYTKGGYEYKDVKQASASYDSPNSKPIYPLTIKSWKK